MAITDFTCRCLNQEPPVIYGDGQQTRNFTHIEDIIEANMALLDTDTADHEPMNVISTGIIMIKELIDHIIVEREANIEPIYETAKELMLAILTRMSRNRGN